MDHMEQLRAFSMRTFLSQQEKDGINAAASEIERLHAALKKIADQKTLSELADEGDDCEGDFEGAYDAMIEDARKSLQPQT